jgi:elongation factor 1 alpha-like protein
LTLFQIYFPCSDVVTNLAAKKREKAHKLANKQLVQGTSSRPISPSTHRVTTPVPGAKGSKKAASKKAEVGTGTSTPLQTLDQRHIDIIGLNLYSNNENVVEEAPKMNFAKEKLLEEARRMLEAQGENDKRGVSLVVIGEFSVLVFFRAPNLLRRPC